jgi:hypothetical protein
LAGLSGWSLTSLITRWMGPSEAAVVVAACWPMWLSTAGWCMAAGAWFCSSP